MNIGNTIRDGIARWLYDGIANIEIKKGESFNMTNDYSRDIIEYFVWSKGCERELIKFYSETSNESENNYFYKNIKSDDKVTHSGLPKLISSTMARLIFSGGVEITIDDKKDQETLDGIIKENKMMLQHPDSAFKNSWGGKVSYKISFDDDVTELPIVEIVGATHFKPFYKRGRLFEIVYNTYYKKDKKEFRLDEIYGKGFIDYKLYEIKGNKVKEVPLNYIEETEELARIEFMPKVILGMVQTNKTIKGVSDYEGLISEFDMYDEIITDFGGEIRDGKTDIYFPTDKLVMGTNGAYLPIRTDKKYAIVNTSISEDGDNGKIQYEQPDIRSTEYINSSEFTLSMILANAGLSKVTIGFDDTINESGISRKEKEKASLRTRDEKVPHWESFLSAFYELVLIANDIKNKVIPKEREVVVTLGDYMPETIGEKVLQVKDLVMANIVDTEKAIDMVFGDAITEEEKTRILENLGESVID